MRCWRGTGSSGSHLKNKSNLFKSRVKLLHFGLERSISWRLRQQENINYLASGRRGRS